MSLTVQNLVDSGINPNDIYVLTKDGLSELTKAIFRNVNTRIEERIVDEVTEESDVNHVASAKTIYELSKNFSNIKNLVITDGDITKANITPDEKTLYCVRKTADDVKATLYIWLEGTGYICCAQQDDSNADLSINAISNEDISQIVADSYNETNPNIDATSVDTTSL